MLSLSHIIKHSAAAMKFHLRMFGTAKGAAHIDGLLVDLTCLVAQPDRQTEDFGSRSGASSGLFGGHGPYSRTNEKAEKLPNEGMHTSCRCFGCPPLSSKVGSGHAANLSFSWWSGGL